MNSVFWHTFRMDNRIMKTWAVRG